MWIFCLPICMYTMYMQFLWKTEAHFKSPVSGALEGLRARHQTWVLSKNSNCSKLLNCLCRLLSIVFEVKSHQDIKKKPLQCACSQQKCSSLQEFNFLSKIYFETIFDLQKMCGQNIEFQYTLLQLPCYPSVNLAHFLGYLHKQDIVETVIHNLEFKKNIVTPSIVSPVLTHIYPSLHFRKGETPC